MKIRITNVLPTAGALFVSFQSPTGSSTALWVGTTPQVGDDADVEFELDDIFSWGKNITASSRQNTHIAYINGIIQITAELIHVADEECAALQLGDSTILIELDGTIIQESGYVDVITTRLTLYPTNI